MGLFGSPDLSSKGEKQNKPRKPFFKRWWFIAIVAIVIIGALGGGGEDTPKVSNEEPITPVTTNNQVENKPVEEVQEFFKMGEVVETKKVKAVITGIEKPKGNDFNKPADGKEFVLLHLAIENISDTEINVSSMLSFNAYADDITVNQSISAQIAKEGTNTVDGTIAVGKKLVGVLGYEVPKDWGELEIHFEPDVWGSTVIKWIIENE